VAAEEAVDLVDIPMARAFLIPMALVAAVVLVFQIAQVVLHTVIHNLLVQLVMQTVAVMAVLLNREAHQQDTAEVVVT
jgi:hypothetical protein